MSLHHNMTSRSYVVAVNQCAVYHGVMSFVYFCFFLHRLLTKTNTRSNYCIFTEIIVNKKKMHKFASISKITDPIVTKINRFAVLTVQKENFCKFSRTKENFRQAYASRHSKNNFSSRFQLTTIRIDLTVIILFPHGT
jgi:hypothetical protein